MIIVLIMIGAGAPGAGASAGPATDPVQSSVSAYLNCPSSLAFAIPSGSGSCPSGTYSAVYTGVSQAVGSTQDSVFYLASANGGVKVTFSVTDTTSTKVLIRGVGYGSISGGTCASPNVILPSSFTSTSSVINSGDTLKVFLNATFTGTGTPAFCSGDGSATLVSIGTTPVTGSSTPLLTTVLSAGRATQTTLLGYQGVSVSYVNTGSATTTALVLGILKTSAGSTVDVLSTSITAAPNQNVTAFLPFRQYSPGTYSVTIIAMTGSEVPISTPVETSVMV